MSQDDQLHDRSSDPTNLRKLVYGLLITVTVAMVCGRICSTQRVYEPNLFRPDSSSDAREVRPVWPKTRPNPMPTFSSNDRSRWATVRALVDEGTYVIGHRDPALKSEQNPHGNTGLLFEDGWQTIDVVLDPDSQQFYSSKPPFLPTLVAGEYWLLKNLLGWTLTEHPFAVVRTVLITFNVIPLLFYLIVLARILERYGSGDWARIFVMAAACFGTMVTPFSITLNNHTLASCTAVFAIAPALRIWQGTRCPRTFLVAGFFASFTACNELPAASLAVMLLVLLLLWAPRQACLLAIPAALLPVAGFFATNHAALGRFTPAYSEFGGPWYEYEGSHWKPAAGKPRRGIDWAGLHEDKATYSFHLLGGHHGLFSLYPIFLLSLAGIAMGLAGAQGLRDRGFWSALFLGRPPPGRGTVLALVSAMAMLLSVVIIGFYILKSSNYGGWSSGPRWLMWLTPLWLLAMLPAADRLACCRWGRGIGYVLLAVSIFSASYYTWNPWRHPWIYNLLEALGWISY